MEHEKEKKNRLKIVIPILCGLLICGIALAICLLNRAEPVEDSLAVKTQNEVMTSLEESVVSTQLPETTPETVSNTTKEEPEIDTTLTGDSILSSGLSLREAWGIYNEFKKSNEEMDLSAEENNEFLNNVLFDLGTTLAQLEYSEEAGMFNEQQQVAQTPATLKPAQPSKGGTDVDGDGIMDYDANGILIPGSSLDKNNNGLKDSWENDGTYIDMRGGYVPSGGEERWFNNLEKNNTSTSSKGGTDVDGDGKIDVTESGEIVKGGYYDQNNNGLLDGIEDSTITQEEWQGGTTTSDPDFYNHVK